jgi:cephalosporin hydroxylase
MVYLEKNKIIYYIKKTKLFLIFGFLRSLYYYITHKAYRNNINKLNYSNELKETINNPKRKFIPFVNGQKQRIKILKHIFKKIRFKTIIETGCYQGSSLIFFSNFANKVIGCDTNKYFTLIARYRCKNIKNIEIHKKNSIQLLNKFFQKKDNINNNCFYFLDAHCIYEFNPLIKELEIILSKKKYLVLIDDFNVPFDFGYGYDSDFGKILDLSYIKNTINKFKPEIFFPRIKSKYETGLKRGYVFLAKGYENIKILNKSKNIIKYSF